jgi:hypothetical protein
MERDKMLPPLPGIRVHPRILSPVMTSKFMQLSSSPLFVQHQMQGIAITYTGTLCAMVLLGCWFYFHTLPKK